MSIREEKLLKVGVAKIKNGSYYIEQLTAYGGSTLETTDTNLTQGELVFMDDYEKELWLRIGGNWVKGDIDLFDAGCSTVEYRYKLTKIPKMLYKDGRNTETST